MAKLIVHMVDGGQGSAKTTLEVSPTVIRYGPIACDEGQCQKVRSYLCKWSPLRGQLRESMGDGMCRFSASARAKTKIDILTEFDTQQRQETNKDAGFLASVNRSRKMLDSMQPVALQSFLMNDSGNVSEFCFDGAHIYPVVPNGVGVEVFARGP